MSRNVTDDARCADVPVGAFTGFGNFMRKELLDWWYSWRILVVFAVPTLVLVLLVFFQFSKALEQLDQFGVRDQSTEKIAATRLLLTLLIDQVTRMTVLLIFIVIFSTMGLLTVEKSTGTLAWNLTKPLGRAGLFLSKWIVAVGAIWLAMCVLPIIVASICMMAYHHVTPEFDKMAPIVGAAAAWIALWVLLVLTISLGFNSQGAVGGITVAFWAVPNILGFLLEAIFGTDVKDWILDRLATNSPFFLPPMVGDAELFYPDNPEWKNIHIYSLVGWVVVLLAISLHWFNRQEVGS
jgi:ABC-type transport system involved in multi-copper enzyme maturation permease subunit